MPLDASSRYTEAIHISVLMVLLARQTDSRYALGVVPGWTIQLSRYIWHGDAFTYKKPHIFAYLEYFYKILTTLENRVVKSLNIKF